jgi:hypothetical protein
MNSTTLLTAGNLLVTLHALGVEAMPQNDQLVLRPKSKLTPEVIDALKAHKADVLTLLTEPRRRWRIQAEALVRDVALPEQCDDFLEMFDEREAIAAIDGGLDDHAAGHLAYVTLTAALQEKGANCEQFISTVR